ncbi:MAG: hypothetical protein IMW92_05140 [Bacillales bacterium]|nr:hypothetical protein [Bacillales bacterium]
MKKLKALPNLFLDSFLFFSFLCKKAIDGLLMKEIFSSKWTITGRIGFGAYKLRATIFPK